MKKLYVFLAFLSLTASMMANPVSKKSAAGIARDFFAQKASNSSKCAVRESAEPSVEMAYESNELYVFNGNDGFVVVSGDDQTEPVLGWSEEEQFDAQNVNPATRMWLDSYKQQIQALKSNGGLETITLTTYPEVAVIVPFKWDQPAPYNKFVPMDEKSGKRCLVGCPAVSLAQVMATVKYPDAMPRPIPAQNMYKWEGNERTLVQQLDGLPVTSFDWSKMGIQYDKDDTTDAPNEVAKLIMYSGYAQGMTYGVNGSGAQGVSAYEAARLYFGFSEVKRIHRDACTYTAYENIIYDELKAGRPVIIGASCINEETKKLGGHSFIVDGYKDGYYHINWGWGGDSDGYFVLSVLNSNQSEAKGLKAANGYSMDIDLVYGFKKPTAADPVDGVNTLSVIEVDIVDEKDTKPLMITLTRDNEEEDFPSFTEGVKFDRDCSPYVDKVYDLAWNLYDLEKQQYLFAEPKMKLVEAIFLAGEVRRIPLNITVPKDVADGIYQLHWMYRDCKGEQNTDKWYPCHNYDEYFVQVSIDGNTLQVISANDDFNRDDDYVINKVEVDGKAQVYNMVTMKFNITNYTNSQNKEIFLWVSPDGKKYDLASGRGMWIDKNATGDVYLTFLPECAGEWSIALMNTSSKDNFDIEHNLLNENQDKVLVEGTSLEYNVLNIDKEAEEDDGDEEPLTSDTIEGEYLMTTTDKIPCTKTLYIILKVYDKKLDKFVYNEQPNDPFNKKVVGEFEEEQQDKGKFLFTNLEKDVYYKLAVGEEEEGKIVTVYDYSDVYCYNGDTPTGISSVESLKLKVESWYTLEGVKLNGKPTTKGVYINNGKKVVIE